MALERQPPNGIFDSTNYTTLNLADIDEDPDSPDGNWGSWDGNGNTICGVDFPTPTGDPNVGADLQEFRVQIRKTSSGGNNADWSLELWENGSQVAVLATGTTTSTTGEVVWATWNALLLGTADGSLVQCKLVQTAGATGQAGNRRGVEVGAVEWNVDYNSATTHALAGQCDGTATVTGDLDAMRPLAGQADGTATVTGSLLATRPLVGQADGTATVTGDALARRPLAGQADGVATVTGNILAKRPLSGQADGVATVTGAEPNMTVQMSGQADGVATVTGDLVVAGAKVLEGSITANATVTGSLLAKRPLVGQADGVATVTADLLAMRPLVGGVDAFGFAAANLNVDAQITGQADGFAIMVGNLTIVGGAPLFNYFGLFQGLDEDVYQGLEQGW